ncbi:hypothetical protein C5Y97_05735 [Blastopirellula marina]|uniref:histidine kinase n=2 Tax=Blastopirellula marina TaxID=124 RepID=A0A2S8G8F5_9BACT|nr:hypothetical protein C5Y98_05735 [Blastopirellula marina]PTL45679.1 hypothetical protein C5Y97_05735 [Blastopirellula marina]
MVTKQYRPELSNAQGNGAARVANDTANIEPDADGFESYCSEQVLLAHEFSNIFSVILGHVYLAQMDIDPNDPRFDDFEQISQSAKRGMRLVEQIQASSEEHGSLSGVSQSQAST